MHVNRCDLMIIISRIIVNTFCCITTGRVYRDLIFAFCHLTASTLLIVFNLVVTPILMEHQVKETDYGTFMSMIEKKNIGEVEVEDNQIIFTDKDQKKYL